MFLFNTTKLSLSSLFLFSEQREVYTKLCVVSNFASLREKNACISKPNSSRCSSSNPTTTGRGSTQCHIFSIILWLPPHVLQSSYKIEYAGKCGEQLLCNWGKVYLIFQQLLSSLLPPHKPYSFLIFSALVEFSWSVPLESQPHWSFSMAF